MGRCRTLGVVLAIGVLLAGCGGDDDSGGGGAETATTEAPATRPTTPETAPEAPDAPAVPFERCVADAGLELKPEGTEYTDDKGESKSREGLDMEGTTYLGFVQWPSKRVADVYEATDDAAAETAEREAGTFVKAFGLDPAKYVRREGAIVLVFDDPPPSEDEVEQLTGCAGG